MNAYSRIPLDYTPAVASSREPLSGATLIAPSEFTYHMLLPSLVTGGDFSFADTTFPAGAVSATHVHPDEDQLVLVLSGEIEVRVAGQSHRRGTGQSTFVARGTEHEIRALREARLITLLTKTRHGEGPA